MMAPTNPRRSLPRNRQSKIEAGGKNHLAAGHMKKEKELEKSS